MKADRFANRNAGTLLQSYAYEWHNWEARRVKPQDDRKADAVVQKGLAGRSPSDPTTYQRPKTVQRLGFTSVQHSGRN